MANRRGKGRSSNRFPLLGLQNHCRWWLQPWNLNMVASWQESDDKPRQCVEKQTYYSADKGPYSQGYGLLSGHIWLQELDSKEGRMPKNWCLWTVVLEKTPESPLKSKEIKPVNLKGDQPWILTGRTDAETPVILVIWCKQKTHWKSPWCWERLRAGGEGDLRGWDGWMASPKQWTWANFGKWWGAGRPGMLQSMGCKESDTTGWLNNNKSGKTLPFLCRNCSSLY